MHVLAETDAYALNYDSLMGVANFENKRTGAMSLLETGSDCADLIRNVRRLQQRTASQRYPVNAPSFAELFDSLAGEYSYDD